MDNLEQLKRRVATEVMRYSIYHYDKGVPNYYMLVDEMCDPINYRYTENQRPTEEDVWRDCPDFTGSLDAARLVEDEIERQGLQIKYTVKLCREVYFSLGKDTVNYGPDWALIRATPEQRCKAALKAVSNQFL